MFQDHYPNSYSWISCGGISSLSLTRTLTQVPLNDPPLLLHYEANKQSKDIDTTTHGECRMCLIVTAASTSGWFLLFLTSKTLIYSFKKGEFTLNWATGHSFKCKIKVSSSYPRRETCLRQTGLLSRQDIPLTYNKTQNCTFWCQWIETQSGGSDEQTL